MRPPPQRPLWRCKHIYHTTTIATASIQMSTQLLCDHRRNGLYADVSTTSIRPPSQRPLCRSKHNYHTDIHPTSLRALCKCKYHYNTTTLVNTILQNAFHVTLTMKMSKFIRLTFLWVHGKNEVTQYSRRRHICLRLFLESIDLSCHVIFKELRPLF